MNIAKGDSHFHQWDRIGFGVGVVAGTVERLGTMRQFQRTQVATHLARVIGELNYVHPFREGNGRTQLQFARLLTERAGQTLDLTRLSGSDWLDASREAIHLRYGAMCECFNAALEPGRDQKRRKPPERDRDHER